MRIFLTGASGYIGGAVLEGFARAGHDVTALVRNPARLADGGSRAARILTGDLGSPEDWVPALDGHDVFVHTAFEPTPRGPQLDRAVVDAFLAAGRRAVEAGRSAAVLYTSGIWVLGRTDRPADEEAALAPAAIVTWRPAHEALVRDAGGDGLRTAVIRPGIVFGGSRGIVADLMRDAANGLIRVVGDGRNRWPLVYAKDVADLYVRVAAGNGAAGVFHASDESDERVIDIVEAIAVHMKVRPDIRHIPIEEARAKQGPYADAITLDQVVRCPRSHAIGWEPSFRSVAANVSRLFEEWRRGAGRS